MVFSFFVICLINFVLAVMLIATVDEVKDHKTMMNEIINILGKHDEEIEGLVDDFNGMNNKLEKDYTNHMKDMNMLNKRIIALSKEGEKA